jgi:glycopeptide antibiotics resistance protein
MPSPAARTGLTAAAGVILATTLPWATFQSHSHWSRVVWVPFTTRPVRWLDLLANVLLYLPLGAFGARAVSGTPWRRAAKILSPALVLSATCELSQVWSHGRFPSTTDLAMNMVGASAGVLLALSTMPRKA